MSGVQGDSDSSAPEEVLPKRLRCRGRKADAAEGPLVCFLFLAAVDCIYTNMRRRPTDRRLDVGADQTCLMGLGIGRWEMRTTA